MRTPRAARVLGTIRRVALSLANAAVDRASQSNPKTKDNTKTFQQRLRASRGGLERLYALVFAKFPNVSELSNWKDASYGNGRLGTCLLTFRPGLS